MTGYCLVLALSYYLMLGLFLGHEIDAVARHEWRILPLVSRLPEQIGRAIFIWAHVPLLAGLYFIGAADPSSATAKAIAGFAIVHVGLHWAFRRHPRNEFNNKGSWLLILGAGIFGAIHLATT